MVKCGPAERTPCIISNPFQWFFTVIPTYKSLVGNQYKAITLQYYYTDHNSSLVNGSANAPQCITNQIPIYSCVRIFIFLHKICLWFLGNRTASFFNICMCSQDLIPGIQCLCLVVWQSTALSSLPLSPLIICHMPVYIWLTKTCLRFCKSGWHCLTHTGTKLFPRF